MPDNEIDGYRVHIEPYFDKEWFWGIRHRFSSRVYDAEGTAPTRDLALIAAGMTIRDRQRDDEF